MNNYTVLWRRDAEAQLVALFLRSAFKDALLEGVQVLDRTLALNPHEQGESRNENMRIAFFRPLCIRYQIDETSKTVLIVSVRWTGD
jgi:hypothetical protein